MGGSVAHSPQPPQEEECGDLEQGAEHEDDRDAVVGTEQTPLNPQDETELRSTMNGQRVEIIGWLEEHALFISASLSIMALFIVLYGYYRVWAKD